MPAKASVLVTRPDVQAAPLCAALEQLGFASHSQPMLELEGLATLPPAQHGQLENLDQYQHLIFISGNAVRFGMAHFEDYWPQLPVGINWYAIGTATARSLSDYGVEALSSGAEMTSESLLQLPQLQVVAGERVLIVKGVDGRGSLAESLTQRGARVEEFSCYHRRRPSLAGGELAANVDNWRIDLILISSGEGLANFLALLSPAEATKLFAIPMVVPSKRVATLAREAGFITVHTAQNASDSAMMQAVDRWWLEHQAAS